MVPTALLAVAICVALLLVVFFGFRSEDDSELDEGTNERDRLVKMPPSTPEALQNWGTVEATPDGIRPPVLDNPYQHDLDGMAEETARAEARNDKPLAATIEEQTSHKAGNA